MTEQVSRRILIVTGDPLGARLSGPGIRAWQIATALSGSHQVRLISFTRAEASSSDFDVAYVRPRDNRTMAVHEKWADVIIIQGHVLGVFRRLRRTRKKMVVDIYDPMHLEQLEQGRHLGLSAWRDRIASADRSLDFQLRRGDFFMCASERQRMFWLGQLMSAGRINPETYASDVTLRRLIDVVPFGLSREKPEVTGPAIRGVVAGIGKKDKVLLWSGGLYDWFDPRSLIRAVAELSHRRSNVRLFFMGTKHPNPDVPPMSIVQKSRDLAAELGVLNSHVFFNDQWVDFDKRQNYLLDADVGVSTHFEHVETQFSFRTRILDYLWAQLPMVVTAGDYFADLVEEEGLGRVVAAEDVSALAAALEDVLFSSDDHAPMQRQLATVREKFFWDVVLTPLVDYIGSATYAADHADLNRRGFRVPPLVRSRYVAAALRHRWVRGRDILLRR
jgi:glycosyltransferase involved in cell wall biosynthesis